MKLQMHLSLHLPLKRLMRLFARAIRTFNWLWIRLCDLLSTKVRNYCLGCLATEAMHFQTEPNDCITAVNFINCTMKCFTLHKFAEFAFHFRRITTRPECCRFRPRLPTGVTGSSEITPTWKENSLCLWNLRPMHVYMASNSGQPHSKWGSCFK